MSDANLKNSQAGVVGDNAHVEGGIHFHGSPAREVGIPFMVDDLPGDFVPRPAEFNTLRDAILSKDHDASVAITTALRGAGGFGKTVLARALCHELRDEFPDGVLWVTLGEKPDVIGGALKLYRALTGERPAFVDAEDAAQSLTEALGEKRCLLVIDDVWKVAHLRPFMRGGPQCKRLITTRNRDTLPPDVVPVDVDAMRANEAVALLGTGFTLDQKDAESLRALAARLGEWPLLLSLVNGAMRVCVNQGQSLEDTLAWVNRALDKRGLTFFDARDAEVRDQAVSLTLGVSLNLLAEDEQARYEELAVLPEDLDIPLAAIEVLWGSTGGLDDLDVKALCQRLANHSLVQHVDLDKRMLRLHDVVRTYLIDQCANLPTLHARLLDAYAAQCEGSWSTGPDDDYFFLYLPHHLTHAGRSDDVRALVLDFDWMWAKLQATDINALLADYDLALSNKSPAGEDRALQLVQEALRLSAHVLANDPDQLPGQLIGRLIPFGYEALDDLNAQARAFQKTTWLCPVISSLTPPGGPLLRTLSANESVISQVHLNVCDKKAISASNDGAIRIWDLQLGKASILGKHRHPIIVLAISNNRQKLASISPDGAIILWNLPDRSRYLRVNRYDNVRAATFLQQEQVLALGLEDGDIALFHLERNEEIDRLTGHEKRINSLVAMRNDSILASASVDGTIKLWDIVSGKVLSSLGDRRSAVRCLAVEPDEKSIVSGSDSGEIALWSLDSGKQLARSTQLQDVVYAVVFTQPSRHLVMATRKGFIGRWDQKLENGIQIVYQHANSVYSLAAFRSSDKVVAAAADGTLMIVNTRALDLERKAGNTKFNAWAIFPNQNSAVTVSQDTTLQIRDLQSGRIRESFQAPAGITSAVATPGNKPLVVMGTRTGRLLCLDMRNGQAVWSREVHKRRINSLDVSPTSHMVASASSDRSVKFWNPYDGERIGSVTLSHKREVTAVRFLAEGDFVVSASPPNIVRMWQVSTGEVVQTFELPDLVNDMAVVKNGKSLILGFQNGQIASYDLVTGELVFRLSGHAGSVNALVILDERELIVSASDDKSLKVWSLKSRSLRTTFHGDSEMVACKALSDGSRILAIERSGRVHILELKDNVHNLERG